MTTRLIASAAAALFALTTGTARAAATPDPGDYTALPAGTDLLLLYGQHVTADDIYAGGTKVVGNADLTLDVGLVRYVHFMKLGGFTIDPQVIIPVGRQRLGLTGAKSSGIGDAVVGGTLWTIADLKNGEHLGFSLFVTAPTGSHKADGFALSDDRWAADFQVGYIRRFAPNWSVDLIGQAEAYQDRRDTGAKKDPLVRGIVHLRYHLSDASHLALSYRQALGAKESLNGATLSSRKNDGNLTLTAASFIAPTVQLQGQYSHDVKVENGPKTRMIGLRTLFLF